LSCSKRKKRRQQKLAALEKLPAQKYAPQK
jgi:hypothetical protein